MFNALDLMENKTFLEKLKFGIGDGNLQYYLYNWKCPSMGAEKVSAPKGKALAPGSSVTWLCPMAECCVLRQDSACQEETGSCEPWVAPSPTQPARAHGFREGASGCRPLTHLSCRLQVGLVLQ